MSEGAFLTQRLISDGKQAAPRASLAPSRPIAVMSSVVQCGLGNWTLPFRPSARGTRETPAARESWCVIPNAAGDGPDLSHAGKPLKLAWPQTSLKSELQIYSGERSPGLFFFHFLKINSRQPH